MSLVIADMVQSGELYVFWSYRSHAIHLLFISVQNTLWLSSRNYLMHLAKTLVAALTLAASLKLHSAIVPLVLVLVGFVIPASSLVSMVMPTTDSANFATSLHTSSGLGSKTSRAVNAHFQNRTDWPPRLVMRASFIESKPSSPISLTTTPSRYIQT